MIWRAFAGVKMRNSNSTAPPTITRDATTYTVIFHTTTVMEAAKRSENFHQDAVKALGNVGGTETMAMPRAGGGYDVSYKFIAEPR